MGQTEILQFLKDNYPKKFSVLEIAKEVNYSETSTRRCINILDRDELLSVIRKKGQYRPDVKLFGAKRKRWEK